MTHSLPLFFSRIPHHLGQLCYFIPCLQSLPLCTPVPTFRVFVSNGYRITVHVSYCLNSSLSSFYLVIVSSFLILDPEKQKQREIKRAAMAEYYEKHGGGDHH
jgi:hypothetical protein